MPIQLRHVRHAVVLADEGSYSAAARQLSLSQPALSRSIQSLEEQLGARLFDRLPHGVEPTAVGRLFLDRGRALLTGASELEREIRLALGLEIGSLRVGAAPYPAEISVGTACGRLARRYPHLQLDVRVGDWTLLTDLVRAGELDVAVGELSVAEQDERLVAEPLPHHQGYYFCRAGHPLAGRDTVTNEDTAEYPLVTSSLPQRFRPLIPTIRVDTFRLARDIVLSSDALGLATARQIDEDAAFERLARLPLELEFLHTNYGFIRLKDRTPSPATVAFMEIVLEVERELAGALPA